MHLSHKACDAVIEAWSTLAIAAVPHTVHNCSPSMRWSLTCLQPRYISIARELWQHRSPWKIVYDHGTELLPPPGAFPRLVDISTGTPVPSYSLDTLRISLFPLYVIEVACPNCLATNTHVIESVNGDYIQACNSLSCPFCNALVWPWRFCAAQSSDSPGNILPLTPNPPKGSHDDD